MKTIEENLEEYKQHINMIQVPQELESRLRNKLQELPSKKRKPNRTFTWVTATATAILLIVGVYQYPAFAYWSGKLLNKMELNTLSFTELSEQGYGQSVNKSISLDDGTTITINGVIADDNSLLMYCTIDQPAGLIDEDSPFRFYVENIRGFLTDSFPQGGGKLPSSEDSTREEWVYKFDPVSPFSRTLKFTFSEWLDNGEKAVYPISFKFDASKAMKNIVQEDISKSVVVDQGLVYYDSITASPTSTIIKGHYDLNNNNGGFALNTVDTKLYVNGTEVQRWGMYSEPNKKTGVPEFVLEYDVLPTDQIDQIELVLTTFDGYQQIEEPISLASPSDQSIKIGDEKIWIRSVTQTKTGYDIVVARKQFILFETANLSVQAGGKIVPISSISRSRPWDLNNGNILWEQTYSFDTSDKPEFLLLEGFQYIKTYNERINIPINNGK